MDEWLGHWPQIEGWVRLMHLWHSKLPPVNPTVEKWYLTQQWVSEDKATAQKKLAPKKSHLFNRLLKDTALWVGRCAVRYLVLGVDAVDFKNGAGGSYHLFLIVDL